MLKRLVRNQFQRHAADFRGGAWLVRLRAPFDQRLFVSAASTNLRRAAASELSTLMQHAKRQRERGLG
jgi:ribonuclease P protein component